MKRLFSLPLAVLLATFGLTACSDAASNVDESAFVATEEAELEPGNDTIAEIVMAAASGDEPQFTLLLAALEYTELAGVFAGDAEYTVFAPTDAAFVNLVTALQDDLDQNILQNEGPFAAIDALLGEGTVANVLLYHVTEGRRAANTVVPGSGQQTITTLLGGATFSVNPDLSIDAVGNTANIISADLSASNGVIHVIDAVILPVSL
jgi:uncharacterized surface protein with fasciclin (FAS1) repeats